MQVLAIGHLEAVLGFGLVGVHGKAVSTADEANQALDEALSSSQVGIVLVTENVASLIRPRIEQAKLQSTVPLVVEIPGPEGAGKDLPAMREVVQQAIGIKV